MKHFIDSSGVSIWLWRILELDVQHKPTKWLLSRIITYHLYLLCNIIDKMVDFLVRFVRLIEVSHPIRICPNVFLITLWLFHETLMVIWIQESYFRRKSIWQKLQKISFPTTWLGILRYRDNWRSDEQTSAIGQMLYI